MTSISGQVVKKLHSGRHLPGEYSLYFQVNDLSAGVYALVVEYGSKRLSRLMIKK